MITATNSRTGEARATESSRGGPAGLVLTCASLLAVSSLFGSAVAAAPLCDSFTLDALGPLPGNEQLLYDITAVPGTGKAWAVGTYHEDGTTSKHALTMKWTGRAWKQVANPAGAEGIDYYLTGVSARSKRDVWAVGYRDVGARQHTLVQHWNGRRWKIVKSVDVADRNTLQDVAVVGRDDVWAVGQAYGAERSETLVQHWDGGNWSVVPSPNASDRDDNRLTGVTSIPGTKTIMAVGYHQWEDPEPLVLTWDGDGWALAAAPPGGARGGYLTDVAAGADGDVWTVGFTLDQVSAWHGLAARWDGGEWDDEPPGPPPADGYNPALQAVTVGPAGEVWAVGYFTNSSGAFLTLAEHWDGESWEVVPTVNPGGIDFHAGNLLVGVAVLAPDDVRAVGAYHASGFDPWHAMAQSWCP